MTVETETRTITIFVNDRSVQFNSDLVTGSEIKSRAGIASDSILYELRGDNRVPVGDSEQIRIHENEHFLDVPGGTVSMSC